MGRGSSKVAGGGGGSATGKRAGGGAGAGAVGTSPVAETATPSATDDSRSNSAISPMSASEKKIYNSIEDIVKKTGDDWSHYNDALLDIGTVMSSAPVGTKLVINWDSGNTSVIGKESAGYWWSRTYNSRGQVSSSSPVPNAESMFNTMASKLGVY